MVSVLPLMAATLCFHGTAVTLEGVLLAQKAFGKLALTYSGVLVSVIPAFLAIRRGLWAPYGSGLLGIWAVYVWFQLSRVAAFAALGGLLPRWAALRRRAAEPAAAAAAAAA